MTVPLFHTAKLDNKGFVQKLDAVSRYPEVDFDKLTSAMNSVSDQLMAYNKLDCEATLFMFRSLLKKLYRKPKTHACGRTMSWAKYAGSRQNKPKHNWGKKRRARMGWTV